MIIAYHPALDIVCIWFYDDEMKLRYWDIQYEVDDPNFFEDDYSVYNSLDDVRQSTIYEILYDEGAL